MKIILNDNTDLTLNENDIRAGRDLLMVLCENQLKYIVKKTLSKEKFLDILYKSNLQHVDNHGWNAAMLFCIFGNLYNIEQKDYNYLIKNSNLTHVNSHNKQTLTYFLRYQQTNKFILEQDTLQFILNKSNLSLIPYQDELFELKKIQSELLNNEILNKIDTNQDINKKIKI